MVTVRKRQSRYQTLSFSAKMTSFSPKLIYSFDEFTQCIYQSPLRNAGRPRDRPVMLRPITDFHDTMCNNTLLNSPSKPTVEKCREKCPKRPLTPFRPTKCEPKISKLSVLKMKKTWLGEEDNRLRGGATIVAKLPYSRCIEGGRRHHTENLRIRKGESSIKCSSDVASMSSANSTPRPQLLSLGSTRLRATSSSGQSSSEKGCCPYHIRVRKRNTSESNVGLQDDENAVSSPRYSRCSDATSVIRVHSALSANTASALTHKPPATSRLPKRALSIEDAIIHLSKRFNSPPSDFTASSSSSSNHKKLVHRSISTNRITDELRAKLGLTPPHKRVTVTKPSGQLLTPYRRPGSYERIMNGRGVGTQTTFVPQLPTRSYSDTQIDLIAKNNQIKCSRCFHYCPLDDGSFTCDTCIEVQRVKNAFVIEIFADRPSGEEEDAKPEQITCYGVRVGAGILPVVVMFVSLIICSVVLLSDSVMSNVCGHYCNMPIGHHLSPRASVWGWLSDPYN